MHVMVAIDGLGGSLGVVVADLPCGEASEEIGNEVEAFLTHNILVGCDAVGVKYLVGHVAELSLQGVLVVLQC